MHWLEPLRDRQARHLARRLRQSILDARRLAERQASQLAHEAGSVTGLAAHRLADYARSEGPLIADAATRRAVLVARAVKDDPLPVIAGLVGALCFASLLAEGRRQVHFR